MPFNSDSLQSLNEDREGNDRQHSAPLSGGDIRDEQSADREDKARVRRDHTSERGKDKSYNDCQRKREACADNRAGCHFAHRHVRNAEPLGQGAVQDHGDRHRTAGKSRHSGRNRVRDLHRGDNTDFPGEQDHCGSARQYQDDRDRNHCRRLIGSGNDTDDRVQKTAANRG